MLQPREVHGIIQQVSSSCAEVYILILNWNGWRDTVDCVESVLQLDHPSFHILVIDNGSKDESVRELRRRFGSLDNVEIVETGANLGFAGGNNAGIRLALERGASYVWLLNNDTTVDPQALSALVKAARAHPEAGVLGSKIYYFDHPNVLWFAGGLIDRDRGGHSIHIGQGEEDHGQYDSVRTVDYITGCSMLMPVDLIRSVGLMDEDYFLYWEEVDYNARIQEAGHQSLYVPASRVWHKVSASIGGANPLQQRYEARNRLYFHQRHLPQRLAVVRAHLLREFLHLIKTRQWRSAAARLRGVADFQLGRSGQIR